MQSFKEFIRVKDRESKVFIRESIYELKHNAFYNTDYFNKKYLYEEDAPEETDAETKDDTEIYIKLHYATTSDAKTIRVTKNNVSDLMPQVVNTMDDDYLFWVQNESMIKMVSFDKQDDKNHFFQQLNKHCHR